MRLVLPLLLVAASAGAEDVVTAEEFEAFSEGRTLAFSSGDAPYGLERYGANRRVLWNRLDEGMCHEGFWYPRGEEICFVYETLAGDKCWRFTRRPGGLAGEYTSDEIDGELRTVEPTDRPLECPGPEVGV